MKKGRKTAIRVLNTEKEAEDYIANLADNKFNFIEFSRGIDAMQLLQRVGFL